MSSILNPFNHRRHRAGAQTLLALCLGGALLSATGCRSAKDEVVFTSDHTAPQLADAAAAAALLKKPSLTPADEKQIKAAVFSDLLTRHFWDDGDYTGIFLQADDDQVTELQKKFASRKPPVKETFRVNVRQNLSPLDKDTGKSAMILSVEVSEPEADGTVVAVGKWFAGGAVTGFYSYQLKAVDGQWTIQNPQ